MTIPVHPVLSGTTVQAPIHAGFGEFASGTTPIHVPDAKQSKGPCLLGCTVVPDKNTPAGKAGYVEVEI
jgi:hypothetical protein